MWEEMKKVKIKDLPFRNLALVIFIAVLFFSLGSLWTEVRYLKKGTTASTNSPDLYTEIAPKGTPDYGNKAGVSYDQVEESLNALVGYDKGITLAGAGEKRYIKIGTSKETACEFCCGIGEAGFGTAEGEIACGCGHNIAFSGLSKWLIQNSSYSDEQIIEEIKKWKILFFPKAAVAKELQKRGISPDSTDLPSQRGGC